MEVADTHQGGGRATPATYPFLSFFQEFLVKFTSLPRCGNRVPKNLRDAGVVAIQYQMQNGCYACQVNLQMTRLPEEYGRQIDPKHVEEISDDEVYDIRCARPPVMSFRDSCLNNVDGNHTSKVLQIHNVNVYDANVHFGLTEEQEAAMFYLLNQLPKRMNSWTAFAAAVKAGRPIETEILKECKRAGFKTQMCDPKDFDLGSTKVLKKIYVHKNKGSKHGSLGKLRTFLAILNGRFMEGRGKNRRLGRFMRESQSQCQLGLVNFLINFPEYSANQVVKALKKWKLEDLQALGREIAEANPYRRVDRVDSAQWAQVFEIAVTGSVKLSNRTKPESIGTIKYRPPQSRITVTTKVKIAA